MKMISISTVINMKNMKMIKINMKNHLEMNQKQLDQMISRVFCPS